MKHPCSEVGFFCSFVLFVFHFKFCICLFLLFNIKEILLDHCSEVTHLYVVTSAVAGDVTYCHPEVIL